MRLYRNRLGFWYLDVRANGKRDRKSTGTTDRKIAESVRAAMMSAKAEKSSGTWMHFERAEDAALWNYLARCAGAARRRDRKRGRLSTLTSDDMRTLLQRSGSRCEVTGIPFSLEMASGTHRRPFAPSIDRVDLAKPYSFENSRLICVALNIAINIWGDEIFARMATSYVSGMLGLESSRFGQSVPPKALATHPDVVSQVIET